MKILFVLDNYVPYVGGAETMFQHLAEGLVRQGHQVKVVCPLIIQNCLKREQINGVDIYRCKSGSRYLYTLLSLPIVCQLARSADIIHTTTYNAAPVAWLVAKLQKKKIIITIHEILGKLWWQKMNLLSALFHWLFERLILFLSFDKLIAVSQYTQSCLEHRGIKTRKITVIYHGLDNDLFDSQKADVVKINKKIGLRDSFTYLFFGRPGITKGLEYLIRAVPLIKEKIKESKLILILGSEPHNRFKMIKQLILKSGISQEIIILDSVPRKELPDYLAAANCVVIPSLSEGFGFSAAESCAMNRPVVVSKVGALPEVVSGRVVWVKPKDSQSIAEGVFKVFQKKWQKITPKKFSWEKSITNYLKLYQKLCE